MRFFITVLVLGATDLVNGHPDLAKKLAEAARAQDKLATRSTALLGDLLHTVESALTVTGFEIKSILNGTRSAFADAATYDPPPKDSDDCRRDTCCIWQYIANDMVDAFYEGEECSALARGAIRLGFHDAGAWSSDLSFGGADGSILLSNEMLRSENAGLEGIASQMFQWKEEYEAYNVSMADMIQFGAMVATTACPGGPRIRFFVGREDSTRAAPTGLMPSPFQTAEALIDLFQAKTFTGADLIALVGAHSVSQQFFVDQKQAGASQDTTAGIWDNNFYTETVDPETPSGVFKFPSDLNLASSPETSSTWNQFTGPAGQDNWSRAYAPAYFRMSLLGVNNINALTDCTKTLPPTRAIPRRR
ncbi:uncharacterized protein E0L32_012224 [Thyridium curvatum]|uniref:Peroxidase n=1 Tax=Thyridium curvatum TaxID=1093900 RepID=A0A507BKR6_9PEZI|nr:uncharacterized protein E0L32_012224 [Thyridium curvatum]TPX17310.1 hypothetical protein E0L32_012224 [Thyridium curvatum]